MQIRDKKKGCEKILSVVGFEAEMDLDMSLADPFLNFTEEMFEYFIQRHIERFQEIVQQDSNTYVDVREQKIIWFIYRNLGIHYDPEGDESPSHFIERLLKSAEDVFLLKRRSY